MRLVKWKCPCSFAFSDGEQHSETDMQMKLSHNNKLHPCHRLHTCEFFSPLEDTVYWNTSSLKANIYVLISCTYEREKCVTWTICDLVFLGFLAMMKSLIFHPCVLFQHFKNTSLPTNVYLNDFLSNYSIQPALLSGSQRWRGQLPRRSGTCKPCKSHILQAFIQTSDISGVPEWANDVQTHSKRCPFLPCLHLKHTTSSLLPPPLAPWFTSSFTTSVTFYGVHTFLLSAQSRPAWRSQKQQVARYLTKHFIYYTLRISLPFRFRHFIVLLQEGHFFSMHSLLEVLHQKNFSVLTHSSLASVNLVLIFSQI